jgi:polysaccharide pyruvyl transferase WcaK-like protein
MNKIKNVLTVNECFSDNLGDQAIAKSLEDALLKQNCRVTKVDFTRTITKVIKSSTQPNLTKKNLLRKFLTRKPVLIIYWLLKNYFRLMRQAKKNYDSVFIGGGQLILNNEIFPLALFFWTKFFYKKSDIHLFAIGVGNDFDWFSQFCISSSLKRCKSISVRDELSQKNLFSNFNVKSVVIPDIAYTLSVSEYSNNTKGNYDLVGITDFEVYTKYREEVGNSILTLEGYFNLWSTLISDNKLKNILLSATTNKDLQLSFKFREYIKKQELPCEVELSNDLPTLDEYLALLQGANKVISGRMHSLILGEVANCEVITFQISSKLSSYEIERVKTNNSEKYRLLDNRICQLLNS